MTIIDNISRGWRKSAAGEGTLIYSLHMSGDTSNGGGEKRAREEEDVAGAGPLAKKPRIEPDIDHVWWFVTACEDFLCSTVVEWNPRSAKDPQAAVTLLLRAYTDGLARIAAAKKPSREHRNAIRYFADAIEWLARIYRESEDPPEAIRSSEVRPEDLGVFKILCNNEPYFTQCHDGRTILFPSWT